MQPKLGHCIFTLKRMDDNKLAEGCKAGDRAAMKALYERFYSKMLGVCLRYSKNFADAEDYVQDGFIKIFSDIRSFKGKGSLEGWIRRVMVNSVLMQLRKTKREFTYNNLELTSDESVEDSIDQAEEGHDKPDVLDFTREEVVKLMQTLPVGFRQVLNMYVIDGYKHREIAEILNISVGTSKSQLNRARKLMNQKLIIYHKTKNKI